MQFLSARKLESEAQFGATGALLADASVGLELRACRVFLRIPVGTSISRHNLGLLEPACWLDFEATVWQHGLWMPLAFGEMFHHWIMIMFPNGHLGAIIHLQTHPESKRFQEIAPLPLSLGRRCVMDRLRLAYARWCPPVRIWSINHSKYRTIVKLEI